MSNELQKDDVFDGEKLNRQLVDEIGQMSPLRFNKGGSQFRWEVLKIAAATSSMRSIKGLLSDAQEIINWINETPPKLPPSNSNQ